jgi:hypothetical protein
MLKNLLLPFLLLMLILNSRIANCQDTLLLYPESYLSSNIGGDLRYTTPNDKNIIHTRLEDRQFYHQYEPRNDFSFMFFQMGVDHLINDNFKYGAAYRHSQSDNKSVHRMQGDFHFKHKLGDGPIGKEFGYRFRAQFSYNDIDERLSVFFRNKFKFVLVEEGKYLNLFIDAEFFNRLNQQKNVQFLDPVRHIQRATLGNAFKFSDCFSVLLLLRGQKRYYVNGDVGNVATVAGRFIFHID